MNPTQAGLPARINPLRAWLGCALLLVSLNTWGDVIHLQNGDRITGTLDSISNGRALIVTEYAGHVIVKLSAIKQIETTQPYEVELSDSARLLGRFGVGDAGPVLLQPGQPPTPINLTKVASAGQDKAELGSFGRAWTSRADLSADLSRGNSDTDKYNMLLESTLKRDKVQHGLSVLLSQEEADDEKTKDQFSVDYDYKRFVARQWYASGNASYFEDELKGLEHRITLGAGMGYQFWDNSFGSLSSELGANYVVEEIDGESEHNPALRWGLDYKRLLFNKQLEYFWKHSLLNFFENDRGQVVKASTGLRLAINERIDTTLRIDADYESEPPDNTESLDTTYNIGIGVKF